MLLKSKVVVMVSWDFTIAPEAWEELTATEDLDALQVSERAQSGIRLKNKIEGFRILRKIDTEKVQNAVAWISFGFFTTNIFRVLLEESP